MRAHIRWIIPTMLVAALVCVTVPLSLHAAPVQRHVISCAGSGGGSLPDIVANVAQSGDTIIFDQDCSDTANTPITLGGTLNIPKTKNLTIDALASTPAHTVIIDGNNANQILRLQAVGNQGPTVTLNGLTLRNGRTADRGGAIFNDQGALTITNSALVNNNAVVGGGGIENAGGTLNVTNSTFSGNKVTGTSGATGGAIDNNRFGKLTLTSVTISGNTVTSPAAQSAAGGGLFDFSQGANAVTLTDSLVAGNTGGNCNGADIGSENTTGLASGGHNLIGVRHNAPADTTCGVDFLGLGGAGDLIGTDDTPITPLLGPLGLFGGHSVVLPLLPGSPALDTGGASCPSGVTTDQRGSARPANGACDIGAFESGGFTMAATGGNNQSAGTNTAFAQPLTVTVSPKTMGEPVANGVVKFTAPATGTTATLSAPQATIGMNGQASVMATAGNTTGMFQVTASAAGAGTATFTLNIPVSVTMLMVTAPSGGTSGNTGTATMPVIKPGISLTLNVVGTFNNGMMGPVSGTTFMSSDPNVVSVDPATGTISGIAMGTATITITAPDGVKTTITVTVGTIPTGGLMNPNPAPMMHTASATMSATPLPQPNRAPNGSTGGSQPQAAGTAKASATATPMATPLPQPVKH